MDCVKLLSIFYIFMSYLLLSRADVFKSKLRIILDGKTVHYDIFIQKKEENMTTFSELTLAIKISCER